MPSKLNIKLNKSKNGNFYYVSGFSLSGLKEEDGFQRELRFYFASNEKNIGNLMEFNYFNGKLVDNNVFNASSDSRVLRNTLNNNDLIKFLNSHSPMKKLKNQPIFKLPFTNLCMSVNRLSHGQPSRVISPDILKHLMPLIYLKSIEDESKKYILD